jgi:phosphotriesterase-related protein
MNLLTVTGPIPVEAVKLADGHAHLWISSFFRAAPTSGLALNNYEAIRAELTDLRAAGTTSLIDCQPGGCGRDARMLRRLAEVTGLHVTATTGFHRQTYYPPSGGVWSASEGQAAAYFVEELTVGTLETRRAEAAVRATTIKVGYEGAIDGQTRVLMEAAAFAARQTGAALLFHTAQGKNVEVLLPFFADRGVPPSRLYLCHMDKRPDLGLHRELAQAGVLLGYDTFARPQYDPERGAWPLIHALVSEGLERAIAIGLDLAYRAAWRSYGGQPGLSFLPEKVVPRLRAEGISEAAIRRLTAHNVAERLVRVEPPERGV